MSFEPLFAASGAIVILALAATAAFLVGIVQFAAPKGTLPHRTMGWVWVALMATVALSSFLIHTICTFGPFSLIHALSILTLVALPVAVTHARAHRIGAHKQAMILLFAGALVIAGAFTLLPGRIMHGVIFGTPAAHGTCS